MAKAKTKTTTDDGAPAPIESTGFWLMKTEPSVFSFDDLLNAKGGSAPWDGVRNFQARNFLRDSMKRGDVVLIYHSSVDVPAIIGLAEVVKEGYPDPSAMNDKSPLFDPKAKARGVNPWMMVDVKATHRLGVPLTRAHLLGEAKLKDMLVLKRGMRLSIQPVTAEEFRVLKAMGKPAAVRPAK